MKIDVYSIMRNEIRLLPYFLRHYETFASRIFVWDDESDDGTRELLNSHPKVTILPLGKSGLDDAYFISDLWPQYRVISRGHADWAICVDADEFVYYPPAPDSIVGRLHELSGKGIKKIRLLGWAMHHDSFPTTSGQIYDEVKMGWVDRWSRKAVVFSPEAEMMWNWGRHWCAPQEGYPEIHKTGISLLHFRYLGEEFYVERNAKTAASLTGQEYKNRSSDTKQKYNMPDGHRAHPSEWCERNRHLLRQVVP